MNTTPMGVLIIDCTMCGWTHPETRRHCLDCGRASAFMHPDQNCLNCEPRQFERETLFDWAGAA